MSTPLTEKEIIVMRREADAAERELNRLRSISASKYIHLNWAISELIIAQRLDNKGAIKKMTEECEQAQDYYTIAEMSCNAHLTLHAELWATYWKAVDLRIAQGKAIKIESIKVLEQAISYAVGDEQQEKEADNADRVNP